MSLLISGIPYDAIMSFSESEIHYVLGTISALDQLDEDAQAKQERISAQKEYGVLKR